MPSAPSNLHRQETTALASQPDEAPGITIVAPCCNEVESLPQLHRSLARLRESLAGRGLVEFLLIDDGSTDNTLSVMEACFGDWPEARVLRHETNRGIAAAIETGLRHARTSVVATLDADCTYDPAILEPMAALLGDDIDMVVASPYHPQGGVEGVAPWRLALSRFASRLYSGVMRSKLHTYTSCVRVYRRRAVVDLRVEDRGFVGVVELLWRLDRQGGKILEYPAVLHARQTGRSKMRVLRASLRHLRFWIRAAGTPRPQEPPANAPLPEHATTKQSELSASEFPT